MLWAKHRYLDASALVKLVVDETNCQPLRTFFQSNTNFGATSLCIIEALSVVKSKWTYGHISEEQYFTATRNLVINSWGKKIEIEDIGLFSPQGLNAVEILAKKHALDLSDALQLETVLRGKYSHLGPNSASVLITADTKLAAAAEAENIRVWNCLTSSLPEWA